jgi:hypothetical protein
MRGGSRSGAGRSGWRRKCEYSLPLDVRRLHRKRLLSPGSSCGWHWSRDGERIGDIGIVAAENAIRLSYTWTPSGGDPKLMAYDVRIERTPCRYGGSRPWFRCPWCHRRCGLLYGLCGDGYFGCRICLRLGYASEAESPIDRCWRQQRKIEAKLGSHLRRPKGMKRKTHQRLRNRWVDIEERKDELFEVEFAHIVRRLGIA